MSKEVVLSHAQEITIVTTMMVIGLAIAAYYAVILAKLSREGPRPEQVALSAERAAARAAAREVAASRGYVTLAGDPESD